MLRTCSSASLSSMACSSVSSRSVTALGAIFTSREPLVKEGARERGREDGEFWMRTCGDGSGRGRVHKTKGTHPFCLMVCVMTSMAALSTSIPRSLSSVMLVMTYMGGAMSLMRTGTSGEPRFSPARRASRMASMPS